jgi:hypothetical protein
METSTRLRYYIKANCAGCRRQVADIELANDRVEAVLFFKSKVVGSDADLQNDSEVLSEVLLTTVDMSCDKEVGVNDELVIKLVSWDCFASIGGAFAPMLKVLFKEGRADSHIRLPEASALEIRQHLRRWNSRLPKPLRKVGPWRISYL